MSEYLSVPLHFFYSLLLLFVPSEENRKGQAHEPRVKELLRSDTLVDYVREHLVSEAVSPLGIEARAYVLVGAPCIEYDEYIGSYVASADFKAKDADEEKNGPATVLTLQWRLCSQVCIDCGMKLVWRLL